MQIIEQQVMSKNGNMDHCEDGLFISDNFVVVIDGVTAKGKKLWKGKKSGRYARDLILEKLKSVSEDVSAVSFFNILSGALKEAHEFFYPDGCPLAEKLRAAVIVYSRYYKEIWSYGDCSCMINDVVYAHEKAIDQLNSAMRSYILQDELNSGKTYAELQKRDMGREYIQEALLRQFHFENIDGLFGYAVLNGDSINESLVVKHAVKEGDIVILVSDGYPKLCPTLKESEHALENVLEQDPLCCRIYLSTKGMAVGNISFDDRCYCRFRA